MKNDHEEQDQALLSPSFRIWLCGAFRVERRVGSSYEAVRTSEWGGSNYPRLLLKALLCCPGWQARREALFEMLWPDVDPEQATHNLNTATTKLRSVLRPAKGQESLLLTEEDASRYRLEGQPVLWVDADAALALLKEAERFGRTTHKALPLLEEADRYFQQGPFLQEEEGSWASSRRATIDRARYRCRLWLVEAYTQQGMPGQAETMLSSLLEEDPTDEDVLCRFMMLLHRQQMTHQALQLYAQTCDVLDKEGLEPGKAMRVLAEWIQEDHEYMPLVSLDSGPIPPGHVTLQPTTRGEPPRLPDRRTSESRKYVRTRQTQREHITLSASPVPTNGVVVREQQTPGSMRDPGSRIQAFSEASPQLAGDIMSRREAGKTIVTLGAGLLTVPMFELIQVGAMLHDEEILAICTTSIPILWRLYFDGQLPEVQRVLPGYLSQLALLVRQPSGYQHRAARVASKAHQLACMLALQEQDYGLALIHADQALLGAKRAEDAHLLVASLIRRALVYRYLRWFKPMLETYQEADQYRKSISPLLKGRLDTGLAEAHSNFGQEDEAHHFLERAYKTFPETPKDDPNFSYTHFKLPQGFEVVMHLNLKQADKAWAALTKLEVSIPREVVPDRVELSIDQARASLLLGDMKLSCTYVEYAATSASALGSHLRYAEAHRLYQQMYIQWPREQQVQALARHFH